MPEEHLTYVGLIPLFLAAMTMVREWRRDPSVRLLAVLVVVTLVLSLGPYAPGFRYLITLPGFSFFRASARWSLATALALALLAGKGFDRWPEWTRSGRSLRRFAIVTVIWILAIVGLLELALLSTSRPGWPRVARGFQSAFDAMPWTGDPRFEAVLATARGRRNSSQLPVGIPQSGETFANDRGMIYSTELWESAVLVMGLVVVARLTESSRISAGTVKWALVVITVLDLLVLGRHRLIGVGPLRPLAEQSAVLARLRHEPRGTRIANGGLLSPRNLPMLVGMAPISAYRTLDLPAVPSLTMLAQELLGDPRYESGVLGALRATGTGLRVFDPLEIRLEEKLRLTVAPRETIDDPVLASWLLDASSTVEQDRWTRKFAIWRCPERPARAWLVRESDIPRPGVLDEWSGEAAEILAILREAEPLATESYRPEEWTISVDAAEPAWVIVSQLADPEWKARWIDLDGRRNGEDKIVPTFRKKGELGGWQRVKVPAPGRWTLRLEYDASDVELGLAISTVAWMSWMLAAAFTGFRAARGILVPRQDDTER